MKSCFSHPPIEPAHFAKEREVKALPEVAEQGKVMVPGWAILHHCSAGYEDGQPKVASVKLPPEYIVSRKGRWAVASRQTGTAKKKD